MPTIQNKRLFIARYNGLDRTVEEVTGAGRKRLENARQVVLGDGQSTVYQLHDPAATVDPITLRCITTRDDPFVAAIEGLFELQRLNPDAADALILFAYADSGATVDSRNFVKAVIQDYKFADGNSNAHGEAPFEFTVQPDDVLP